MENMIKKYFICLISLCVMVTTLSGCGKELTDDQMREASENRRAYTYYNELVRTLTSEDLPVGDFVYGKGNEDVAIGKAKFDTSAPVLTICINPFSDEELVDDYVEEGVLMDKALMSNPEYCKYIKENDAYYITYECCDEELYHMDLNGKVNTKEIKKAITEAVEKYRPVMQDKVDEFIVFLDSYEGIEKESDGIYYYVIDSKNITESIESVMTSVDEIANVDPFKDSRTAFISSSRRLGYVDGGCFKVYLDKFGGDLLVSADEKEEKTSLDPGYGERRFTQSKYAIRNDAYRYFVDMGWIYEDSLKHTFYSIMGVSGEFVLHMWEFEGENGNIEYSTDELYDLLYSFYDETYNKCHEHGIALEDIPLTGTMALTDRNDGLDLRIECKISFAEHMTKEEFTNLLNKNSSFFDPHEFELEDDCF